MINRIWVILLFLGIVVSALTGKFASLGNIMLNSAQEALDLFLKIATMLIFWSGIIRIALDAGLINKIAKLLLKPLSRIFPDLPQNSKALELIAGNVVCNLWAWDLLRPPRFKSDGRIAKGKPHPEEATRSMSTFVLLNAALTVFRLRCSVYALYTRQRHHRFNPSFKHNQCLSHGNRFNQRPVISFWCSRKKP